MTRCSRHKLWPVGSDWAVGRTLLGGEGGSKALRQVSQRNPVTSVVWYFQDLASKRYSWFLVLAGICLLEKLGSRWSLEVTLNNFVLYCDFNVDLMTRNPRGSFGSCRMRSGSRIHIACFNGRGDTWRLRREGNCYTCPQGQRWWKQLKRSQGGSLGGEWRPKHRI